jgi:hypothetical protein
VGPWDATLIPAFLNLKSLDWDFLGFLKPNNFFKGFPGKQT